MSCNSCVKLGGISLPSHLLRGQGRSIYYKLESSSKNSSPNKTPNKQNKILKFMKTKSICEDVTQVCTHVIFGVLSGTLL